MSLHLQSNQEAVLHQPPFVLRWDLASNPLPVRAIRGLGRKQVSLPVLEPPPWLTTGPAGEAFQFGEQVRRLCADIAARCAELRHIDVARLLVGATQARNGHVHGLQARVTPLRFRNGQLLRRRRGILWQVQRFFVDDREMLYLMTFCLPRFLDQSFDEKLITLFHELYHIGPAFDGDLRRHEGHYCLHSHSQRGYDEQMAHLAREYLNGGAEPQLHAFLRLDFGQLLQRHGSVVGVMAPRPRLIPLPAQQSSPSV